MADAVEAPIKQSLVAEIVGSYVKKNQIAPADLPTLIAIVHRSLLSLGKPAPPEEVPRTPAISVRRSVTPNNVTCIECGWRGLMLRRHLRVSHGLSAQEYRTRWRLNPDHALTAPAYSIRRSTLAKQLGLGQKSIGRGRRRLST